MPASLMREDVMRWNLVGAAILAFGGLSAEAQTLPAEELAGRSLERRAVEAMIWAMRMAVPLGASFLRL